MIKTQPKTAQSKLKIVMIKTQPKTAQSKLTHAPICHPEFLSVKHMLHMPHAPPPVNTRQRSRRHAPTFFHTPHMLKLVFHVSAHHHHDVSPSDIGTMTSSNVDL